MPVLTEKEEAFLSAITTGGRFTLDAARKRYASNVRLRDLVTTDAEIMGGVPIFAGTRVPIDIVLGSLDRGIDWDRLVASYPFLTDDYVLAAKVFVENLDATPKKGIPPRPVPVLTPEQIALYGGITANKEAFSLKTAVVVYRDRKPPREMLLALKKASVERTLADAGAAHNAGTLRTVWTPREILRSVTKPTSQADVEAYVEKHFAGKEQPNFEPLTPELHAALDRHAPRVRGKVISSIQKTLDAADEAMNSPSEPKNVAPLAQSRFGLAWSNPGAQKGPLLQKALLQGRFYAILEAAAHDGVPFVRQQMQQLRESGELNAVLDAKLERMVKSIETGFAQAVATDNDASSK